MELPKKALDLLKRSLEDGDQTRIANELGTTQENVCMQLNGNRVLKQEVYECAIRKVKEKKLKNKKIIKDLIKNLA